MRRSGEVFRGTTQPARRARAHRAHLHIYSPVQARASKLWPFSSPPPNVRRVLRLGCGPGFDAARGERRSNAGRRSGAQSTDDHAPRQRSSKEEPKLNTHVKYVSKYFYLFCLANPRVCSWFLLLTLVLLIPGEFVPPNSC